MNKTKDDTEYNNIITSVSVAFNYYTEQKKNKTHQSHNEIRMFHIFFMPHKTY